MTKFSPEMLAGLRARGHRPEARSGRGFGRPWRADPRRPGRRRLRPAPRRRVLTLPRSPRRPRPDQLARCWNSLRASAAAASPCGDDPADAGTFVDHRRVELDEAGAGRDPLPGVIGIRNAADADQRDLAAARVAERVEAPRAQAPSAARPTGRRLPWRDAISAAAAKRSCWRRSARRRDGRARRGRSARDRPAARSGATLRKIGLSVRTSSTAASSSRSSPSSCSPRSPGVLGELMLIVR